MTANRFGEVSAGPATIPHMMNSTAYGVIMSMDISTGEKIRIIRIICKRQGVTLSELAEKIGKSHTNFSNQLLRDQFREPEIQAIAQALKVEYISVFRLPDGTEL
jgi:DNA-binding transcriptional ArsR family regulator